MDERITDFMEGAGVATFFCLGIVLLNLWDKPTCIALGFFLCGGLILWSFLARYNREEVEESSESLEKPDRKDVEDETENDNQTEAEKK